MNKLVLCTVGVSIAKGLPAQKEMLSRHYEWDEDASALKAQIAERMRLLGYDLRDKETRRASSAELDTLYHLGIEKGDIIVLLSSDNAQGRVCTEAVKEACVKAFGLSEPQVIIERIRGLQVNDANIFRKTGVRNLVNTVLNYFTDEKYSYNYEIILNQTGGFKGVVPFLTIMGMLYGKRVVYMFEYADELISLPPMPVSFDLRIFNRARYAIDLAEKESGITPEEFLSKIQDYSDSERALFMSFTEPLDERLVMPSPLAYCLVKMAKMRGEPLITEQALDALRKAQGERAVAIKRLAAKSVDVLWRNTHMEAWNKTDLLALKQNATSPRIAGFVRGRDFFITHVFASHDEYLRELGKYEKKDFQSAKFVKLNLEDMDGLSTDAGADELPSDSLLDARDRLAYENSSLREKTAEAERNLKPFADRCAILETEIEQLKKREAEDIAYILELEKKAYPLRSVFRKLKSLSLFKN